MSSIEKNIDLSREAALSSSSTTESCEPPHSMKREKDVISGPSEERRKNRKSGECTPDFLELSHSRQRPQFIRRHRSQATLVRKWPKMSSRERSHTIIKLYELTIVNEDCDGSSSDGWLDITLYYRILDSSRPHCQTKANYEETK